MTKDLSELTVNTRREKFQTSKENTSLHKMYYDGGRRLNDLALLALHPTRLSELSTEKTIEMFVQAILEN